MYGIANILAFDYVNYIIEVNVLSVMIIVAAAGCRFFLFNILHIFLFNIIHNLSIW